MQKMHDHTVTNAALDDSKGGECVLVNEEEMRNKSASQLLLSMGILLILPRTGCASQTQEALDTPDVCPHSALGSYAFCKGNVSVEKPLAV